MKIKNSLFNIETAEIVKDRLKTEINSPFVSVRISTLGGNENLTIMVAISTEPKENWLYGIFENSNYRRFSVYNDGTTENFVNSQLPKVRKFTVKSVDKLIEKLNKSMSPGD